MMHIRDPVVGDIIPTNAELALLEDPSLQRLTQIRQLGFAYLVYPGANGTRFEHSLGTMALTREIASLIGERDEELECAGLLHDIGHAAFSHTTDSLLKKYLKTTHETIGEERLMKSPLKDAINDSGLSAKKIIKYFRGRGRGEIVTGALGSDRLDYLIRDSRYTGVAYGLIDYQNIKSKIVIHKDVPAIYESGIRTGESILLARYFMFESVYLHHATRIAQGIYEEAVSRAIDSGNMRAGELKELTDWQMLSRLSSIKESSGLIERITKRRLFKRAYYKDINGVDIDGLTRAIEKSGFKEGEYLSMVVNYKGADDNINVLDRSGKMIGKLIELSPLINTLSKILKEKQKLLVACDKERAGHLSSVVEKFMRE